MSIARAALVVLIMNLASRLLGFVRDAVIAKEFGASGATDAYFVAYTLPYSLQAILGMAFVTVMVPAVTGYLVKGEKDEGWRVASSVFNATAVILSGITVLGLVFAPWLVRLLAPGFTPEDWALTTHLTRIMFPSIVFMGLGMMVTGILNAHKKFGLPAFAPALANIIVILTVVLFGARYRIEGLAAGTLVGFIGFLLVQLPLLGKIEMRYRFDLDWKHPAVKRVAQAVLPVTFAVAVNQIVLAMNRFFASGLVPGSITALDLGNRVMNLPLGIFAAAVSTATFPALAEEAARKDWPGFIRTFSRGFRMVSLTVLPAAVGLIVLREPVIRLLFERGAFDAGATRLTTIALLYFSAGLWFLAANTLLTRAYYALADLKAPVIIGIIAVFANWILSLILLPLLGHGGLALANTLAGGVNAGLLLYLLSRKIPGWSFKGFWQPLGKMLTASLVMGIAVRGIWPLIRPLSGVPWFQEVMAALGAAVLGAVLYTAILLLVRLEEAAELVAVFKRKLFRGKN